MAVVNVSLERVAKRFGRRWVFTSVTGALGPGRVVVVTGHNGSGKSTLLNVVAGVLRPSSGTVTYRDGDGASLPRGRWPSILGVAAPDMSVYDELTAAENLRFFARVRGLLLDDRDGERLLADVGLAPREQRRPVGTYSSGMRQRVKLAQAVVHQPSVLLLDEPSSNLDAEGHQVVADLVAAYRTKAAVAVASNDPREIAWGDERIDLDR